MVMSYMVTDTTTPETLSTNHKSQNKDVRHSPASNICCFCAKISPDTTLNLHKCLIGAHITICHCHILKTCLIFNSEIIFISTRVLCNSVLCAFIKPILTKKPTSTSCLLMPRYLPLPHPMSASREPGGWARRKSAIRGQGE